MLIIFTVYIIFIVNERRIYYQTNPDNVLAKMTNRREILRLVENIQICPPTTLIQYFQRAVRKVIVLNKIRDSKGCKPVHQPSKNPVRSKFFLTVCVWLSCVFLTMVYLPIVGKQNKAGLAINAIFCSDDYYTQEMDFALINHKVKLCHTLTQNYWIKAFMLLNLIYVLISVCQIKKDYDQLKGSILNTNWLSKFSYIAFKIFKIVPFCHEINTTITFWSANTSLQYMDWLKVEDIKTSMMAAKFFAERSILHKSVGQKGSKAMRIITGFAAFVLMVGIGVFPLVYFYQSNNNPENDKVLRGTLSIEINLGSLKKISLINDIPLKASQPTGDLKTKYNQSNIINKIDILSSVDQEVEITPPVIDSISTSLSTSKQLTSVIIHVKLWTQRRETIGVYLQIKNELTNEVIEALKAALSSDCTKTGLKDEIFLTKINPKVIIKNIKDEKIVYQNQQFEAQALKLEEDPYIQKFPIILQLSCTKDGKKFIGVSNKDKNHLVVTQSEFVYTNESIKAKLGASVIVVYGTLIYIIGKSLMRKNLVGKATTIWIDKIQNSSAILLILEGVRSSRNNMNLFREKTLYYRLVDLIRTPKGLMGITGSLLKLKKEKILNRLNTNTE